MATIRREKKSRFSSISNGLLADATLSFECRGMLGYLLSKPSDWTCRVSDIEREGQIGERARRRIMLEAETAGYLTFTRVRQGTGRFDSFYTVHEEPVSEEFRTKSRTAPPPQNVGVDHPHVYQGVVEPGLDEPGGGERRSLLNTELLSTDSLKTDLQKRHDDPADAGAVGNSLAVIGDKARWTIAGNDPGGLPVGVVYDLCGGNPPSDPEVKRLVGFLVDSSFSGLAVFQLSQVIKGRVNGTRINSVGYYFPEIRRLEQFCHLQLSKPDRQASLAGATPDQRWANELGIVRRIVEQWRKG